MHTDDVRMRQLGQAARLLHEQAHDRPELTLLGAGPGVDGCTAATAQGIGEAFLDYDRPVERILCQVGYPEAAAVQKAGDDILAFEKRGTRLQLIQEVTLRRSLGRKAGVIIASRPLGRGL